jgi:hypothetical protein
MPNPVPFRISTKPSGQPHSRVKGRRPIRRFSLWWPYLLFAGLFLLSIRTLVRLANSPLLLPLRGDMQFYNDWAQRIVRGEIGGPFAFYGLPGYAYLLAFLYKIFGYNLFVPGLLQAGLDAGIALLIYQISVSILTTGGPIALGSTITFSKFAHRNYARALGAIAALGWAFFVPAQAYSVSLMPTVWFVFVFWFVVWRVAQKNTVTTAKEYLLLGLLIGITATAVAAIFAIVPLIFAALLFRLGIDKSVWRVLVVRAALFVAGISLGTSPCWIHNYFFARDPVFLSAHSGINVWIGNHPGAIGYPRFPPGLRAGQAAMLQDSITQAEAAAGHHLKRAEVSAYWSAKAKGYIVAHFGDWVRLLALKLRNFWNAFQYDDLSIITVLREEGVIFSGLSFGVVSALAIPGMLLAWPLAPRSRWITAAILLSIFALLTVFITERYRLVAVPGLLVFAVFGLSIFWQACAANRPMIVAIYLFLLLGSTLFVSWPQRDPSLWALDAYNSGWQALESQNLSVAEKKLAIAYAYVPSNPETNFALGNLKLAEGQNDSAAAFYFATLKLDADHRGALNNLGVLALNAGRYDAAENWLRRAEDVDPSNAKTRYLRARVLLAEHDLENARQEIDRAIALDPGQPEFGKLRQQIVEQ